MAKWGGRKAEEFTRRVLETYGDTCWLCLMPGADTADHLIPRSKGGALYSLENARPAHGPCNSSRGNQSLDGPDALVENGLAFFR